MGADLYGGALAPKLVELMAVAVDASCTHLYTPGIRRHVQGALAQGATIEEIMEVLKLCGALGVDACDLGAPILAEELTEHQKRGCTIPYIPTLVRSPPWWRAEWAPRGLVTG